MYPAWLPKVAGRHPESLIGRRKPPQLGAKRSPRSHGGHGASSDMIRLARKLMGPSPPGPGIADARPWVVRHASARKRLVCGLRLELTWPLAPAHAATHHQLPASAHADAPSRGWTAAIGGGAVLALRVGRLPPPPQDAGHASRWMRQRVRDGTCDGRQRHTGPAARCLCGDERGLRCGAAAA